LEAGQKVPLCVERQGCAGSVVTARELPDGRSTLVGMPMVEILDGPPEWAGAVFESPEDMVASEIGGVG
jgi:hypothetical protein